MSSPPAKQRVQDREDETPAWSQCGADGRNRAVEVVDVGEAETTGHHVELTVAQEFRRCHVSVDITDAKRLVLLGLQGFPDQVS